MEITLRNAPRRLEETGYGRINAALAARVDTLEEMAADVHLFSSPPYSFYAEPGKFNVGLTMCDRALAGYDNFPFVALCNKMQLILVPSQWDYEKFRQGGVRVPMEIVRIGHEHAEWEQPIVREQNRCVFMLDRGRDYPEQLRTVWPHFQEMRWFRRSGQGTKTREELRRLYHRADVFVKWAEEGAWSYPMLEAMSAGCLVVTNCPYNFTNTSNSLTFQNAMGLTQVLMSCRTNSYIELKRQAQRDAASWTWQAAWDTIKAAIVKHYK